MRFTVLGLPPRRELPEVDDPGAVPERRAWPSVIKTVMGYGDGAGAKRHSAARSAVHSVHGLTSCPIGRLRSNRLRYFTALRGHRKIYSLQFNVTVILRLIPY